ncbi:hypothetical protein FNF29_03491 [Cafeteria roenbergensis]|uniref:Uncharacterized protein n=1 Tax=Cafeteria roenbergensis TaxID=33653 RepID=A0A5A8CJC6_CAFRO|nr:hypothetical protein FNF29_03491 [Cafeteria roenbergensis]|eukprot:KAA0152968.1 hypothetical protein FNF29_03491 [Cafeteria roenbergensis]
MDDARAARAVQFFRAHPELRTPAAVARARTSLTASAPLPSVPLRPRSFALGGSGSSQEAWDAVARHRDPSCPSDVPPLVSNECPEHRVATTLRVSVPLSAAAPLLKRTMSGAHVRRHVATAMVGQGDTSMCPQWDLRAQDALASSFTRRRGELSRGGRAAGASMALTQAACRAPRAGGQGPARNCGPKGGAEAHVGRMCASEAARRFGYQPAQPSGVRGPAGPEEGEVRLFYSAVEASAREQAAAASAATGVRGPVSAATEGLLSAMTAFRFGLQRVEARRRWLSAAVDGRGVAVPEGAGVNAASVEKFPCAVR